jgi:hypothetical protein
VVVVDTTYPGLDGRPETHIKKNKARDKDVNMVSGVYRVVERFSLGFFLL